MEIKHISSAENEYIKKIIKLKNKKYREMYGLFVAEGERSAKDALCSGFSVDAVIMTDAFYEKGAEAFAECQIITTTESVFGKLCDTKTPQGVLAVVAFPAEKKALSGKKYIYCDCVQDPGNAGTIIRSCDAFGFDGVIFSKGSVDAFSPKVIRSSMGAVFHIPVITEADDAFLQEAKENGYFLSVTALHKESVPLKEGHYQPMQIFVIGNEGNGVSDAVLSMADEVLHIPMPGNAESLNAGVAASILMYEVSCYD